MPLDPGAARRLRRAVYAAALAAAALVACSEGPRFLTSLGPPDPPTDRPIEVLADGFVSSDACRACHPSQYDTWHASHHRRMTQEVRPSTVIADIVDGAPPLELEYLGRTYLLERRGDEYWVELDAPDHQGPGTAPRVWRQLVLSTGSHHFQAFWFASGKSRKLSLFLFCYRIDCDTWMPVDSAFLARPDVHRETGKGRWNVGCQQCHVTQGRPRLVSEDEMDTHVVEFGIACEACHGQGAEHVSANRDPLRRYRSRLGDGTDETIVDPEDLKPRLTSQVCGQCHGITELKREEDQALYNSHGTEFQPGKNLTAKREVLREGDQYFWSDGMVRVSGREYNGLIESPCFQHDDTERVLTCLSCHQLHFDARAPGEDRTLAEWTDDQLAPGMRTNAACTQCHEEYADGARLAAHTHHDPASAGSECMSCHMPFTTWGLLKSIRSHTIDSPDVAVTLETGRPNACNLCHLDQPLAWTSEHLGEWFGHAEPQLGEDERDVAASVHWLLSGDAGQRGLIAAAMGHQAARAVSGTEWMPPYLAQLLEDPYDAVRFRAGRSLGSLPGFEALAYDFVAPPAERRRAREEALAIWERARTSGPPQDALLLDADGDLQRSRFERLLSARDDRPMVLAE